MRQGRWAVGILALAVATAGAGSRGEEPLAGQAVDCRREYATEGDRRGISHRRRLRP